MYWFFNTNTRKWQKKIALWNEIGNEIYLVNKLMFISKGAHNLHSDIRTTLSHNLLLPGHVLYFKWSYYASTKTLRGLIELNSIAIFSSAEINVSDTPYWYLSLYSPDRSIPVHNSPSLLHLLLPTIGPLPTYGHRAKFLQTKSVVFIRS